MIMSDPKTNCPIFIKYTAKGEQEFVLPFVPTVTNPSELEVLINDVKQVNNFTLVKADNNGCKIVFQQPVGASNQPATLVIYKLPHLQRLTNFSNFIDFTASNLNIEFNGLVADLQVLNHEIKKCVKVSSLYADNQVAVMPVPAVGKGLYWGKNGLLHNTDTNLNDLLNQLNIWVTDATHPVIPSHKILVDTSKTSIKASDLQSFLIEVDAKIAKIKVSSNYRESCNNRAVADCKDASHISEIDEIDSTSDGEKNIGGDTNSERCKISENNVFCHKDVENVTSTLPEIIEQLTRITRKVNRLETQLEKLIASNI